MSDLFGAEPPLPPLAEQLRPGSIADIVGQDHLTGPTGAIGRMPAAGQLATMIPWGRPGTGKTTIERLLADSPGTCLAPHPPWFVGGAGLTN